MSTLIIDENCPNEITIHPYDKYEKIKFCKNTRYKRFVIKFSFERVLNTTKFYSNQCKILTKYVDPNNYGVAEIALDKLENNIFYYIDKTFKTFRIPVKDYDLTYYFNQFEVGLDGKGLSSEINIEYLPERDVNNKYLICIDYNKIFNNIIKLDNLEFNKNIFGKLSKLNKLDIIEFARFNSISIFKFSSDDYNKDINIIIYNIDSDSYRKESKNVPMVKELLLI